MRNRRPGLAFGLLILALGVILFLDRQGILNASDIFPFFWPVVLLVAGVLILTRSGAASGRAWGGILTAAGILLILDRLGYVYLSFQALWPLALIAVGLMLVWRTLEGTPASGTPERSGDVLNRFAAFGGGEVKSDAVNFRGGDVLAIFGGYQVDLRKAAIETGPAVLNANALFGGIEIKVPASWRVRVDGLPILGGYSDETEHPDVKDGQAVEDLLVRGFAMFGGVAVKN
jgi:predicted membrane protein